MQNCMHVGLPFYNTALATPRRKTAVSCLTNESRKRSIDKHGKQLFASLSRDPEAQNEGQKKVNPSAMKPISSVPPQGPVPPQQRPTQPQPPRPVQDPASKSAPRIPPSNQQPKRTLRSFVPQNALRDQTPILPPGGVAEGPNLRTGLGAPSTQGGVFGGQFRPSQMTGLTQNSVSSAKVGDGAARIATGGRGGAGAVPDMPRFRLR